MFNLEHRETSHEQAPNWEQEFLKLLHEPNPKQFVHGVEKLVGTINHLFDNPLHNAEQKRAAYLAIEQAVFKAERTKMAEENRSIALAPRTQEFLLKQQKQVETDVRENDKAGGVEILVGAPGLGKTELLLTLARRLNVSNGVLNITVNPSARVIDHYASPDNKNLTSPTYIAKKLATSEEHFPAVWELITTQEMWTSHGSVEQLYRSVHQFLSRIGFTSANEEVVSLEQLKQVSITNAGEVAKLLLSCISPDRVGELRHRLQAYFEELAITTNGSGDISVREIFWAMRNGYAIVIDELEKERIGSLLAGTGAEGLLTAKAGQTFTLNGVSTVVKEGFLIFATANRDESLPDHIKRRLLPNQVESQANDFFYQARVLLTSKDGEEYLLKDRPQDDSELTYFLLWFSGLSRFKENGYHTNTLATICKQLRSGDSFNEALEVALKPDIRALYNRIRVMSNAASPLSLRNFSLLALNEVCERSQLSSQAATGIEAQLNSNTKSIELWPAEAPTEGEAEKGMAISRRLPETFPGRVSPETKVLASPSYQTMLLADSTNHALAFFDLPSKELLTVTFDEAETTFPPTEAARLPHDARPVLTHFSHDNSGFIVGTNATNELIVFPFTIQLTDEPKSPVRKPKVIFSGELALGKTLNNQAKLETRNNEVYQGSDLLFTFLPKNTFNRVLISTL